VLLMVLGAAAALCIVVWNVRRAGVTYGGLGSLLQAGLFAVLGYLGVVALGVVVLGWVFVLAVANLDRRDRKS
jgi:hypothetical protein